MNEDRLATDTIEDFDCAPAPMPDQEVIITLEAPAPNCRNYFARHWHGELPLAIAYWVNGVSGGAALVPFYHAVVSLPATTTPESVGFLLLSLSVLIVSMTGIMIWQAVGIWRSATEYSKRTGRLFWAAAAQCTVAFAIYELGVRLGQDVVPLWVGAVQLAIRTSFGATP